MKGVIHTSDWRFREATLLDHSQSFVTTIAIFITNYIFTVVSVIVFSHWKLRFVVHILLVVKGVPHEGPLIELSTCALLIIFAP